jgi:hypothetical protein
MAVLYRVGGGVTARNVGFRPGQCGDLVPVFHEGGAGRLQGVLRGPAGSGGVHVTPAFSVVRFFLQKTFLENFFTIRLLSGNRVGPYGGFLWARTPFNSLSWVCLLSARAVRRVVAARGAHMALSGPAGAVKRPQRLP